MRQKFHGRQPATALRGEPHGGTALAPRLRRTLDLLLSGNSEKETAKRLGLSHHTVHEYVKDLYRHFGVRTRAELMARWIELNAQ